MIKVVILGDPSSFPSGFKEALEESINSGKDVPQMPIDSQQVKAEDLIRVPENSTIVSESEYWFNRLKTALSHVALKDTDYLAFSEDSIHVHITIKNELQRNTLHTGRFLKQGEAEPTKNFCKLVEACLMEGVQYPHYEKYIGNLKSIDFYGICNLFEIKDHSGAFIHGLKKMMNAGKRGAKDSIKDMEEGIQSSLIELKYMKEAEYVKDNTMDAPDIAKCGDCHNCGQ